jgi:hypothetical protein
VHVDLRNVLKRVSISYRFRCLCDGCGSFSPIVARSTCGVLCANAQAETASFAGLHLDPDRTSVNLSTPRNESSFRARLLSAQHIAQILPRCVVERVTLATCRAGMMGGVNQGADFEWRRVSDGRAV